MSQRPPPPLPARFEVRGLLGRGGMGSVYECWDHQRSELVALKTLDRRGPRQVASIKREFRVLEGISHPNVIAIYELFAHEGLWFFTMELVPGLDLDAWLRLNPGPERLRHIVRQLARGLLAIHGSRRVHRDVKPDNIRVTDAGRVVLLDFGISSRRDARESHAGTLEFMAPEQLDPRGTVQPPADAFALGVVIYEALTGRLPHRGTGAVMLAQKLSGAVSPIREALPEDLTSLAMALLRRDPRERPSMHAVLRWVEERREPRFEGSLSNEALMVGRSSALRMVADAWSDAALDGPVMVALTGPDGIGRTRALSAIREALDAQGATVIHVSCDGRESIPYRGVERVVDGLVSLEEARIEDGEPPTPAVDMAALATLFEGLHAMWPELEEAATTEADPVVLRHRAFVALAFWIRAHAPLAILIDDAHHLDGDGRSLLDSLSSMFGLPLLVVLAARERPVLDVREHPLRKLDEAELVTVARAVGREVSPERVAEADGRPGHLLSLLQSDTGPDSRHALEARLAVLSAGAAELLGLAAISRSPLDIELASIALGTARARVLADVQSLIAAHLLSRGATLAPSSPSVAAAVVVRIDERGLAQLHLRLAQALESRRRAHRFHIAAHYERGGRPDLALPFALSALADSERGLAFEQTAAVCALLARLEPPRAATHLERQGRAYAWAGQVAEAAGAYLAASVAGCDAEHAQELRRLAAAQLIHGGYLERGQALLREVLGAVGVPMPKDAVRAIPRVLVRRAMLWLRGLKMSGREGAAAPETIAKLDACWTACALMVVDIYYGAYFQTVHLSVALDAGDPLRASRALALEIPMLAAAGQVAASERAAAQARALAERSGDTNVLGLVEMSVGFAALQRGDFRGAQSGLSEGERLLSMGGGTAWELVVARVARAWVLAQRGQLRTLRAYMQERSAVAEAKRDLLAQTYFAVGAPSYAWLLDDEPSLALAAVEHAMAAWPGKGFSAPGFFALISRALVALYEGRAEVGSQILEAAGAQVRRSLLLQNQLMRITWHELRARLALANGELVVARRAAERLGREGVTWASALAAAVRAQLAPAHDEEAWQQTVALFDEAGMELHAAAARDRLGQSFMHSRWVEENRPKSPARLVASLLPGRPR